MVISTGVFTLCRCTNIYSIGTGYVNVEIARDINVPDKVEDKVGHSL